MRTVAILCTLVTAGQAQAEIAYAKLADLQIAFDTIPAAARDKLTMQVRIVHVDEANHTPIHLWVIDAGKRVDIPLTDGALPPVRRDWVDRNLMVQTDQPEGGMHTDIELFIKTTGSQQIAASYLIAGAVQAQQAIIAGARHMGGYLATMMAPKVEQVDITLPGCCDGLAKLDTETFKQALTGKITIPLNTLTQHSETTLALSARPISLNPTN